MRNFFYSVKNLHWVAIAPLAVILLVFPLFICSEIRFNSYSPDNLYRIGNFAQMLLPIASTFWPVFVFRQYVEGNSRELIFCYRKSYCGEILFYGLSYFAVMLIPFFVLSFYYQNIWWEYLRVAVQSLFFLSCSYAIVFLMHSTALSLLFTLLVEMFFVILKDYINSKWSIFSFDSLARGDVFVLSGGERVDKYIILILLSILFWGVGSWRSRRFRV